MLSQTGPNEAYNRGFFNKGSVGLPNDLQTQMEFNRGVSARLLREDQAAMKSNLGKIKTQIQNDNLRHRFGCA